MNPTPPLRIRDVDDLLAMVPYLLGYQPSDSIITVLTNDRRLVLVARLDLPDPNPTVVDDVAHAIVAKTTLEPVTTAILIGYGPPERVTPIVDAARAAYTQHGITVADAVRVTDGRWFSYLCTNPDCCPPDGTTLNTPIPAVVAAATVAGRVALPDRDAVAALVAPVDGLGRDAMTAATQTAIQDLDALIDHPSTTVDNSDDDARAARALLDAGTTVVDQAFALGAAGQRLDDQMVARLGVLLSLHPIRDLAAARIQTQPWQVDLWADIVRRVDPVFAAAPACLLAYAAWRTGHGALAKAALDRALAAEPDDTLAHLLTLLLTSGISPHRFGTWLAAGTTNPETVPDDADS